MTDYTAMLDRRLLPRDIPYDHKNRLMCRRDESGRCFLCKRKIGQPRFEITGQKAIEPEKVEMTDVPQD